MVQMLWRGNEKEIKEEETVLGNQYNIKSYALAYSKRGENESL